MPSGAPALGRWALSTRIRGEVLTAAAEVPDLQLCLLAAPQGLTREQAEAWLSDVAAVARETEATPAGPEALPGVLRNALTGLMFSHAELWDRGAAGKPCSVAFVTAGEMVGFGIVGEAEVAMLLDGRPHEPAWLRVRDEQGREARAWSKPARHALQLRIVWSSVPGQIDAAAARLEADWQPAATAAPRGVEIAASAQEHNLGAAPPPDTARLEPLPQPAPEPAPAEPFIPLSSRLEPEALSVWDRPIPPSPEPGTLTMRAVIPEFSQGPREIELPPPPSAARETVFETPTPPAAPAARRRRETAAEPALLPSWLAGPATPPAQTESVALADPVVSGRPAVVGSMPVSAPAEDPSSIPTAPAEQSSPAVPAMAVSEPYPEPLAAAEGASQWSPVLRPTWPSTHELERAAPRKRSVPWWWIGLGLALIGAGWLVGSFQDPGMLRPAAFFGTLGRGLGIAGPHFTLEVSSAPEGASIAVDGKPLDQRTPASIALPVGEHRVTVSAGDRGGATFTVRGERKGERVPLAAVLWGALEVVSPDAEALIAVAVDGVPRGFAPLRVDSLAPGAHEVRYSGPGMASWGQTIEIRAREKREILARPLQSPASGMILVRAVSTHGGESQSLTDARVWLDGEARGVTPLTLELPRGPHSIRVAYRDRVAPVQVIDLPGGNQRFANFEFGADVEAPRLVISAPERIALDAPALISAVLESVTPGDLREMWLHVRTPEGPWRRYPMTLLQTQGSAVGAFAFPVPMLGPQGRTWYYVSAVTAQGDEHFTELQMAQAAPRR
jgi:PEGA domain-containing protein